AGACDEELHPPMSPLEEELQQAEPPSRLQAMEDELAAKNLTVEELSRELEEIRAAFGAEGVQQLQDFEAALKQRDGIITQLTANLQQARTEKDEVMREFLELTEQSQKLQLQFQQLQVGESLRSSSISSTAADLIQARQQVLFFQQQLEDRGVKVKDLQVQLEERDIEVIGLQEKLLQMTQRLSQIETVVEQERLIAEQQQLLAQLQDNLQASKNHLNEVSEQLAMKVRELEACELDLQTSRQKERLSSGEIQQLMGTVEDLQKRYHHQGAEQGDTARKMDYLRAELDEMYGQQIVQMKQELSARHAEELARIRDQHSAEVDKISEHLRAKWTQSAGEVNALNARVVELQQKLQENQVLREKAEQDLAQVSENKLLLQNQVQELVENLRLAKQCNEMERSQTVQQELQAAISDLQAKLVAAHEASSELEAKHESEITNYQIKLEMLEREKDAVLDRMAESQEAELERLRTQLLFSHEEELFRLREDLQHESQMNMENLRDELRQVRNGYEAEKVVLDAERVSLLQEIVVLKHDLSQALENSRVDELVSQLKELQEEVQELRKRDSEKSEPEVEETWKDNLESENKLLKEKETAMVEELKSLKEDHEVLLKKMGTLATDNEKANKLVEELRAEIEKQKTTFSFAEKNFEINCQELREELEERLRELTLQYETKLQKLQTKLQTPEQGHEKGWTEEREEKETDGAALVEKDVTELMEKLQRVELEKAGLEEKVEQKQTELQKMEGELQWVELEKVELLEQKEAHLRRIEVEKVELVEQFKQKEEELCHSEDSRGHRDDSGKGHGEDSGGDHGERSGEAAVLCPLLDDDGDEYVGGVAEAQALLAQLQYELALQAEEHSEVLEELRSSHALQLERHRDQLTQEVKKDLTIITSSLLITHYPPTHVSLSFCLSLFLSLSLSRNLLRKANEKLRQVLVDVLKTTAATEETIGRHVETLLEASSRGQQPVHRGDISVQKTSVHSDKQYQSMNNLKTETDEGLEMSQMLLGAGLHLERVDLQSDGAEPQMEREEYLSSISSRLQSAVEKLLFTITETTSQLEHARVTQTELMREKFRHSEEIAELLRRQEELQERLQEEASARQRLALQLHNAEGLIDGYSGERRALEEQVRERAELQLQLEQELQVTSSRLHELEDERQNLHHQRELLHRQQEAMRGGAGGRELHLLEETEKLMQEKVEVQRQAEKEHAELLQQVKQLEAELEEQVGHFAELEDAHRAESADLTQQIHALEKQLENNRRFLDEQAVDREHERDVFQQEIQKLEQQLKNPPKPLPSSDQHHREVEELSSALREKADWCSELLLRSEQLQREVEERDEEIEKLESRVRALEQALTANADTLKESKQYASMAAGDDATLEALLQTEREALDRKEKEIVNLEEQLEQFREELQNKSEEVQQLHMQLEIQRKEINTQQQELLAQTDLHAVRERSCTVLEQKDREIALLNEHIAKVQLAETSPDNKVEEKSELVLELEAQVEYLRGEQERLKRDGEEEVEQLNSVIEKLQQELSHIEHKQSPAESVPEEEEYDELKQKMDQVVRELDTLKTDHSSLLGKYESLRQEALERELETEKQGERLEDALRERTAALVVAQAQVQALEESAGSRVSDLTQRIAELEESVEEKELELHACRLQVGRAQDDAESLHLKVSQLEDKLREKASLFTLLSSTCLLGPFSKKSNNISIIALGAEPPLGAELLREKMSLLYVQPEKSANGSQASCQTRVDAGTQVEQVEVSEELEEVIGEYRERIGQMQELHAAEIMDMENRHISESDSLKRENQRLEQECSALRAAVANLRSGEVSHSALTTPFIKEVHQEGMQVLSLSEIPVPEAEHPAAQLPLQAWRKEKEALLDTVESLKTLVTQLQTHSQTQTDTEVGNTQVWQNTSRSLPSHVLDTFTPCPVTDKLVYHHLIND
uniref:Pericentrin/AKAP-450 centrosomal targeting domain-containing protein n=1 Tax=Pygocentrus nattereri TaxID=42514 RepID=A0AAR2KIC7_PYGNA